MDATQLEALLKDIPFTQKQAGNNRLELVLQHKDRFATKQLIEKRLSDQKIAFKDGVKSSSSLDIKTTDFTSGPISYRLYYKPKSGGSGAGAEVTALGECFQAYASYARQISSKKFESPEEVIELLRAKGTRSVDADRTLQQCIEGLDPEWLYSGMATANELKTYLGAGTFTFHRGSDVVNKINSKYQELSKKAGVTLNVNKWNPADIWALKDGVQVDLSKLKTLAELNDYIKEMHLAKKLVGVSLKKVPTGTPKGIVHNVTAHPTPKYQGFRIAAAGKDFFGDNLSKDVYVSFTDGGTLKEMQIRTFSAGMSGWQGEIKGATAAGGKIGGGNLEAALTMAGIPTSSFTNQSAFKSMSNTKNAVVVKKFSTMYKYLSGDKRMDKEIEKDITTMLSKYDNNWFYSKFLGMQFLYTMLTSGKQNQVMQGVVSIASSTTEVSSVYIKYS